MSDAGEIVNETDWQRTYRLRREAVARYNASKKGRESYARQLEKQREEYRQRKVEPKACRPWNPDRRPIGGPMEGEWYDESALDGVWYEDDPRASILWPETPRLTELLAQRGLIGLR